MQLVGALQKHVGQTLGFLEFRVLLLATWSSKKLVVQSEALKKCSAVTDLALGPQSSRQEGSKLRK